MSEAVSTKHVIWKKKAMDNLTGYLFLTPWLIGLLSFTIIPILVSLYLAFTDYNMLTPPQWIGLQNFQKLVSDPRFQKSVKVTLKFVFIGVPLKLIFALLVAMILNQKISGLSVYRAVYYLPSLLGSSVAVSILWRQVFNKRGLFNQFLALFGIAGTNWIASPSTSSWQSGNSALQC